jgi:hypothetical protein
VAEVRQPSEREHDHAGAERKRGQGWARRPHTSLIGQNQPPA